MASVITAEFETQPDNDRFLPRYLTVQLLEILSEIIPHPSTTNTEKHSSAAQDFIAAHKNPELFNPLTYKLFWREDIQSLLNSNAEDLDDVDKFGHSALTIALANENFPLALELIHKGAILFLEDKLVLEIALTSMLQRDQNLMSKIVNAAGKDAPWAFEYLSYINGYITGTPRSQAHNYRDVFNPTIRHFGQVLDTMVYFNGTPSHYGFISPSLDILTKHLSLFCKDNNQGPEQEMFAPIAEAFALTQRTCKFIGNLPTENAAEILTTQILNNLGNNSDEPVLVVGGCAGNAIAIAFFKNTLILSNLGMGGDPQHGTAIYAIKHRDKISIEMIDTFLRGLANATDPNIIYGLLGDIVEAKPMYTINQFLTPVDNCIFVNPRAIIQGILLVIVASKKQTNLNSENLLAVASSVERQYKIYMNSLYENSTADLANFMRNHELLRNKRVECCSLALEYINQHYMDPQAVERCIALKNALEFVGLRDYYNEYISPEAKLAIQGFVISQQEATALRVIELETQMMTKQ